MPDTALPSAEQILQEESKPRPLPIEPWVAVYLSRLWQAQKKNIQAAIASDSLTVGQANPSATP